MNKNFYLTFIFLDGEERWDGWMFVPSIRCLTIKLNFKLFTLVNKIVNKNLRLEVENALLFFIKRTNIDYSLKTKWLLIFLFNSY